MYKYIYSIFLLLIISCDHQVKRSFFIKKVFFSNEYFWEIDSISDKSWKGIPLFDSKLSFHSITGEGYTGIKNDFVFLCNKQKRIECDTLFSCKKEAKDLLFFETTDSYQLFHKNDSTFIFATQDRIYVSHSQYPNLNIWQVSIRDGVTAFGFSIDINAISSKVLEMTNL